MKMIFVSEKTFNEEFQKLLTKLELDTIKEQFANTASTINAKMISFESLHRKFNYEIHLFKDALEKA